MATGWPFTGRRAELDRIAQAIRDPTCSGLVLAGPAGVGKSRLVREATASADPRRYHVLSAVATTGSESIPFGALAPFLPSNPPASAAPTNLLRWAADELTGLGDGRRVILVVDDAQHLDETSAALLVQLVRDKRAFVLATLQSGQSAPQPIVALWKDGYAERIELAPLTEDQIQSLLGGALGGTVADATARRLWDLAQGNLLLLCEMMIAAVETGALTATHGIWRIIGDLPMTPRLVELVKARLGHLTIEERTALELVTYGEPLGLTLLTAQTSPDVIEALEEKQLVAIYQDRQRTHVRLAHPLYGEVVRAECPDLRARRRCRELAEMIEATGARRRDDILRLALWRLESGSTAKPDNLLAAAKLAWATHDLPLAIRLARAALDADGSIDAATMLAQLYVHAERPQEAEDVLKIVWGTASDHRELTRLAVQRAGTLNWGLHRTADALDVLASTERQIRSSSARQAFTVVRAAIQAYQADCATALRTCNDLLEGTAANPLVEDQAMIFSSLVLAHTGQHALADQRSAAAVQRPTWRTGLPFLALSLNIARHTAAVFAGRLDDAEAFISSYHDAPPSFSGWNAAVSFRAIARAQIARLRGRVGAARRHALEGMSAELANPSTAAAVVAAEVAHASALTGDLAAAQEAMAEADRLRVPSMILTQFWVDVAAAWVQAASGDVAAAVARSLQTAQAARDRGLSSFELVALHDVVRLGQAERIAPRLVELGTVVDGEYAAVCVAHSEATDGDALWDVGERFVRLGMLVHAAEAAAQAADAYLAAGFARKAQAARGWSNSLRAHCEGVRTPPLAGFVLPAVTSRERQIAQLVAAGMTSRQIAGQLCVSVRTVDNHLHHLYAKLGVRGRAELRKLFGPGHPS